MLAIAGGKGGSGKTTTALGLAAALARAGADPLVVDADVTMPDLHVLAEVPPEPTTDALARGRPVERVSRAWPDHPGVDLIPAGGSDRLGNALRRLRSWHGPILVDCPAGAGVDATRPLRAADRTLLVTTADDRALADTGKTEAIARAVGALPVAALVRGRDRAVREYLNTPHVLHISNIDNSSLISSRPHRAACRSILDAVF